MLACAPLVNAAMNMPVAYVKVLLDVAANVNYSNANGDTELIIAAAEGETESVEFLLSHEVNIRAVSSVRGNALQAAFNGGKHDCVEILINRVSRMLMEDTKDTIGGADGGIFNRDTGAESESSHGEEWC